MKSLRAAFSRADTLLLSTGLAGIIVYLLLLPFVHPDAAPEYALTKEEILDRARTYAVNRGYNISEYEWDVEPIRTERILDSLQTKKQGRSLYNILQDSVFDKLPAYGWEAIGRTQSRSDQNDKPFININLTQSGDIWQFEANTTEQIDPVREVLLRLPRRQNNPDFIPDSVDTVDLVGRFWMINTNAPPPPPFRRNDSLAANRFDRFDRFDVNDAKAIAGYYIDKSVLKHYTLRADSVTRPDPAQQEVVRVRYNGTEPASGLAVRATVDVTISGVLKKLSTSFAPAPEKPQSENNIEFGISADSIPGTLSNIAYLLLALFTFILFLRRLNARLIDVKGALQDAIWGGLFAFLATGGSVGWQVFQENSSMIVGLLITLGLMLAAGSVGAFLVFIISCATDSIARTVWPQRLATLTMARNVRFFNVPMGQSLIRIVGLAGIFLGITTLFMYLPGVIFSSPGKNLSGAGSISPFVYMISTGGLFGMLNCMMLLLSFGATLYNKRSSRWLVVTAVTILAALLQIGPLNLNPGALQWLLSGLTGFVLISSLFRFDYFSCFGGFSLFTVLWQVAPYWLISVDVENLDLILAFGLIPVILVVGFVGLIGGKEVDDVDQFLPIYLREMAQQERMRGELEIARQVQSSLLPRRMPTMPGVDIAAMCLPAQEVGGDYFDFILLDKNRLALIIGDVSGKGIQAGFFMTLTKGFIHAVCETVDSPAAVLTQVNKLFCKNVPRGTFISLIYGILDVANNTFTFARAGHDPVLFCSDKQDAPVFHKPRGMAIGLTPTNTFKDTIQDEVIPLRSGDLLVFYTDGVTEAVNHKMEQFGVNRLAQKVEMVGLKKSARQVLQEVSEHIQAFVQSAGRVDDMTMLVVRMAPSQDVSSAIAFSPESASWLKHEI